MGNAHDPASRPRRPAGGGSEDAATGEPPAARALVDARALAAVAALSLSTFVQNGFLYPPLEARAPWALAACGLAYAAAFALWALAAHRRRKPLPTTALSAVACAALAAGAALWVAAAAMGYPAVLAAPAVALLSCGRAWAIVVAGLSLTGLRPRGVLVTVAGGVFLSYVAYLALGAVLAALAPVLYALLPVAALAVTAGPVAKSRASLASGPGELAVTNPGSFPGPFNRLFVCIFLFEVGFGLSIEFGADLGAWWAAAVPGAALLAVAAWCARTRSTRREDALFHVSALLVVFGFLMSSAQTALFGSVAQQALAVGAQTFNVLTWVALSIVAARNPAGGVTALGQGFCASNLGATVGVVLGQASSSGDPLAGDVRLLVLALVAAAFVGYVWMGLRGFSFTDAIQGVKPVEEVAPPAPESRTDIEARCERLARAHGLTEREGEVFALLARGRNGAFIQEECRVTRNTAKTHIRHIYQKLGVHTQQELIDLVEGEAADGAA
ncbi:helix-turn-helix transcriptional regulator [Gordonibacter massiliensis (ex Traore et al. 2017)]|uniref:Helix-turn-helix transcriptional regulator n=1 Tax=Gordonibacter massiliensis (ex Traore et al. 2017) TaxID=1841863 RepID=A0A842JDN3_9ACTN|nr:helix-turn-helix transcriptional regulator [Gordonibacter massiliensis (ex Traore et al. 2017)]MBC2889026.1 helix-turn-helix transcriptional regulator [Gordonibacter massiliensis (ex Traore et al. 2017)]